MLHNMLECSELGADCHVHDEWTHVQVTGKTKSPIAEEAEYTVAFAWSAGVRIMKHFFNKGIIYIEHDALPHD